MNKQEKIDAFRKACIRYREAIQYFLAAENAEIEAAKKEWHQRAMQYYEAGHEYEVEAREIIDNEIE